MPDPLEHAPARLVGLLVAVVAAVVAIGIATGMAPQTYQAKRPPLRERAAVGQVPAARSHAELEVRPWTGGVDASGWLESKVAAAETAEQLGERDPATLRVALDERSGRRAFDGAPPVIPHPVRASGAAECLACHANGFALGGLRAGAVPHAEFASCTQCHVSAAPFAPMPASAAARVESSWVGLRSPSAGETMYAGAPPAVPHPTRMRERCEACHGPGGRAGLQTPHPERLSCLQCHPATGGRNARLSR